MVYCKYLHVHFHHYITIRPVHTVLFSVHHAINSPNAQGYRYTFTMYPLFSKVTHCAPFFYIKISMLVNAAVAKDG